MGATKTVLSQENISNAQAAVRAYKATCIELFQQLEAEITNVTPTNFQGDAAAGYLEFFSKIKPSLTTQLTGDESVTAMLEKLLEAVTQMLNPVDTEMGNANKGAAADRAAQ